MRDFLVTLSYVLAGVVGWFVGRVAKEIEDDQDYPVDER
jgi:membrane protein YqaA with SNARE-associated domain